ncbi:MAG: nuclear transport factor 2 family protein [Candidatus Azotimanducaceae bacterium]|jgi:limonene-1,2-epoxide hydrolase
MAKSAKETIEEFWRIQDNRIYSALTDLFAEEAVLVDPFFGTFEGKEAIGAFMMKMNQEMQTQQTHFEVSEIEGGGETAWAQWVAVTPQGRVDGCGLYRVKNGEITYYKDYMNAPTG